MSHLTQSAILFIGSAPRPQALILHKIAAAAWTCGLDLCPEAYFPCGGKKTQGAFFRENTNLDFRIQKRIINP